MITTLFALATMQSALAEDLPTPPAAPEAPSAPPPAPPAPAATFTQLHLAPPPTNAGVRHGVRTGYVYVNGAEDSTLLKSPHLFALGYEAEITITGDKGIDFIIVPNGLLLGLNQGLVLPSASVIFGLSLGNLVKFGVGANASPSVDGTWVHMVAAVEIVPSVGQLQIPLALSFLPGDGDAFRVGFTVGVNWPKGE